jgi:tRNA U34 2-thiouridine synthase MnmA/TrmU
MLLLVTAQYTVAPPVKGNIVTPDGVIVGQHEGLWHFTIGQKAKLGGMDQKYFVARKNPKTNEVLVVPGR